MAQIAAAPCDRPSARPERARRTRMTARACAACLSPFRRVRRIHAGPRERAAHERASRACAVHAEARRPPGNPRGPSVSSSNPCGAGADVAAPPTRAAWRPFEIAAPPPRAAAAKMGAKAMTILVAILLTAGLLSMPAHANHGEKYCDREGYFDREIETGGIYSRIDCGSPPSRECWDEYGERICGTKPSYDDYQGEMTTFYEVHREWGICKHDYDEQFFLRVNKHRYETRQEELHNSTQKSFDEALDDYNAGYNDLSHGRRIMELYEGVGDTRPYDIPGAVDSYCCYRERYMMVFESLIGSLTSMSNSTDFRAREQMDVIHSELDGFTRDLRWFRARHEHICP